MKYQLIILLICGIKKSFQIDDNTCFHTITGRRDTCCYNYEWIGGMCKQCKLGTTTRPGGKCMSCKDSTFGYKCLSACVCNHSQRCDPKVGCIQKTNISIIHTTYTDTTHHAHTAHKNISAGPSEQSLLRNEKVTTDKTIIRNGNSKADWIVYILCITSCLCLSGSGHCFRIYRKRRSLKVRAITATTASEPLTPYIGNYTDVDKKPLTLVTMGSNVKTKASHKETVNFVKHESQSHTTSKEDDEAGYFDLYFDKKEDVDPQVEHFALRKKSLSISSFNSKVGSEDNTEIIELLQEYFHEDSQECEVSVTVHNTQSYKACNADDEDDEAGYFYLYFGMKEDLNQQDENHSLRKESLLNSLFNSHVVSQDNTEFYEPLLEYCQDDAHACDVSVTVHERQTNIACNEDDEADEAGYFDLYFDMKKDGNHHALRQESLSISSLNSKDVSQDNTEFLKPLSEYCQGGSHAREVSLKDKQCIKRSLWSLEDAASNIYANVYQLLQKDKQSNNKADENRLAPDSDIVFNKTQKTAIPSTYRTGSLQDYTNKFGKSMKTIDACDSIDYSKDKSFNEKKSETF